MQDALRKVQQFHETFGIYLAETPTAGVPDEVLATRLRLFEEELREYQAAAEAHDLVAIADALTDMLYVLFGTYVTHGMQDIADELFAEVHRSNMSKLDADGRPIVAGGKVQKSAAFSPPDLAAIIGRMKTKEGGRRKEG